MGEHFLVDIFTTKFPFLNISVFAQAATSCLGNPYCVVKIIYYKEDGSKTLHAFYIEQGVTLLEGADEHVEFYLHFTQDDDLERKSGIFLNRCNPLHFSQF